MVGWCMLSSFRELGSQPTLTTETVRRRQEVWTPVLTCVSPSPSLRPRSGSLLGLSLEPLDPSEDHSSETLVGGRSTVRSELQSSITNMENYQLINVDSLICNLEELFGPKFLLPWDHVLEHPEVWPSITLLVQNVVESSSTPLCNIGSHR